MNVSIKVTSNFQKEAKRLIKKFKSLKYELVDLQNKLIEDPRTGTPLGNDCYKIRLKITSKGKGKSGGARVITLLETEIIVVGKQLSKEITVLLLTIYDKSEVTNLSDRELSELITKYRK